MDAINEFVTAQAGALWVYPVLFALCAIDGFFPPLPSESVLMTLASLSGSTGRPFLSVLIVVAALGAIVGDNIAYEIGRRVGADRFAWMRKPKAREALTRARHGLDKRGVVIILTARYIPIGRVAVNMTAGATHYPRRKFVPLTVVAGVTWALYGALMGRFVGDFFDDQPLIGAGVSIVVALILGVLLDRVMRRFHAVREAAAVEPDSGEPEKGVS